MRVIVPLAGPDFVRADGSVKALETVHGRPLLRHALESRPWAARVPAGNHTFVFADRPETRAFAAGPLAQWYRGSSAIFLGSRTQGAAFSALAGAALSTSADEPLIVDLADILYASALDPEAAFAREPRTGGIALTFESASPTYSYLRVDNSGEFVEAAEKRVISDHASAGTYIFSNTAVFLRAVAHAIDHYDSQHYNGLLYICPLFNGVRNSGYRVELSAVSDVTDIKQGAPT
jgi:bifunctional N-acetylglucosamine-1-phosphate-uridyltransferase/glucosamine-1-phosphate-acetyltransferase GlmU-like protein